MKKDISVNALSTKPPDDVLEDGHHLPKCVECQNHWRGPDFENYRAYCRKCVDVVYGRSYSCVHVRQDPSLCGREGRWFEPFEPSTPHQSKISIWLNRIVKYWHGKDTEGSHEDSHA